MPTAAAITKTASAAHRLGVAAPRSSNGTMTPIRTKDIAASGTEKVRLRSRNASNSRAASAKRIRPVASSSVK